MPEKYETKEYDLVKRTIDSCTKKEHLEACENLMALLLEMQNDDDTRKQIRKVFYEKAKELNHIHSL